MRVPTAQESMELKDVAREQMEHVARAGGLSEGGESPSRGSNSSSLDLAPRVSVMKIVISTLVMVGVAMSIICLFSDMFGTGESIIDHLLEFGARSWTVFFVVVAYATFMYLLDVSYWSGLAGQVFRRLTLLGLAAGMCVLAISLIREEPYMPLTVFIFLLPTAALAIRFTGLRNNNAAGVAWVLGTSFLVAAVVCLLLWVLWVRSPSAPSFPRRQARAPLLPRRPARRPTLRPSARPSPALAPPRPHDLTAPASPRPCARRSCTARGTTTTRGGKTTGSTFPTSPSATTPTTSTARTRRWRAGRWSTAS